MTINMQNKNVDAIIEFKNVYKKFAKQEVLQGASFVIPRGAITFIIGQSGEGKSVILKHIAGILKPTAGEVFFNGKDMTAASNQDWILSRKKLGFLFQDGALFDSLSVLENVIFAMREHTSNSFIEMSDEAVHLLEMVGLQDKLQSMPADLSIGEKKRVGLARALSLKPELLLYDEPTTSMDSLISELIDNLIIDTQKRYPGMTSVVVSHDVRSILEVAENIIFLVKGKIYATGTKEEFLNSQDGLILQFLRGERDGPLTS